MDKDKLYISHISESIEKIEKFIAGAGFSDFSKNELMQSGVIRELGIIGEAAKQFSDEFKSSHSAIPWKKVAGMRDKLVHDYFEIDLDAVWKTVKDDLPILKKEILKHNS